VGFSFATYNSPVFHLAPHPELHAVFEALGYVAGYLVYRRERHRLGDGLPDDARWSIIAGALVGALIGSRLLGLLEQAPLIGFDWAMVLVPGGGKTVVGGLLGGWCGVEIVKRVKHIRARTGDLFALPLCVGIAVGRIGCLLAGLTDDTYGTRTTLPWGVDFGDGIARHPTQAYEIFFLLALGLLLSWRGRRQHRGGTAFQVFLGAYLLWRLLVDFIKPQPLVGGLNAIQWTCCAGLVALAVQWVADTKEDREGLAQA
jgi:phosphatidylglycerol:prolipoprotein diacylglycerol transferase